MKIKFIQLFFFLYIANINCQFLSYYSELTKADSAIAYLKDFQGNWKLDYKSYDHSTADYDSNYTIIYSIGREVPAFIDITNVKYSRDKRPYSLNSNLIEIETKDTTRIVSKILSENDSLIRLVITTSDTVEIIDEYYYKKEFPDFTSYNSLSPNGDTLRYRTISFKDSKADLLSEYEANFDVSPKVWYNSYTEKYYYTHQLLDSIVRTQYHADGSLWVMFTEKYQRDLNNKLYYIKQYVYTPSSGVHEFESYINVYGSLVPNFIQDHKKTESAKIYSAGDKITWDEEISVDRNSMVLLYNLDGRPLQALAIDYDNHFCLWPRNIPVGIYNVIIKTNKTTYNKVLLKSR